jgi:hypothetical protein
MAQLYTVIKQQQIRSRHGNKVIEITLVGCSDRLLYRTFLDPNNRNYKKWSPIVHQPYYGFLLTGLKILDKEKGLVSADSAVRIVFQTEYQSDVYNELIAAWQQQDKTSQFGDFFEQTAA